MRYDVNFSYKHKDNSGWIDVENDCIKLTAIQKRNKVLEWVLGGLGAFLGSRMDFFATIGVEIGIARGEWLYKLYDYAWIFWCVGIAVMAFLGVIIARWISARSGKIKTYHSFSVNEVRKVSYLPIDGDTKYSIYRIYVKDDTDFIMIKCHADTNKDYYLNKGLDTYMKCTFADVITEVDH